jgi:tetratricopeptide (TPR) repeat protein
MSSVPRQRLTDVRRLAGVVVAALALLAYGAALAGAYVFDDLHSIAANPALHGDVDWWRLCSDPSAFSSGLGRMVRPVLLLSFAANLQLGSDAVWLKAGNVLLHALVATLLFGWLLRLTGRTRAAFAAAALFAVHPLASEAINLVSARSELLLALGLLLGLRAHLGWLRGGRGATAVVGMLAGGLIACGSKETGVVLPALLVVQAWCLGSRRARAGLGAHAALLAPLVALVLGYLALRKLLLGQTTVALLGRTGDDPTLGHGRDLVTQLATMGLLLPKALLQVVWPFDLSLDPEVVYRHTFADPLVVTGWLAMAGLTAAALWPGRQARTRRLGCAVAWATALPWVVVPLNMPLAEHRLYCPLLGAAAIAAALLARRPMRVSPAAARPLTVARVVCAGLVLVGAAAATLRSLDYRDEERLWRVEVAARPSAWRAWWGLGASRLRTDPVGAVEPLATAHALNPRHFDVLRNYTEALTRLPAAAAQPFRALAVATALTTVSPRDPWARTLLAEAHLQAGRATGEVLWFTTAEELALSCLQLGEPKALVYRMAAAARRGALDHEGALAHLDTALAAGFDYPAVRLDRARTLRDLGRDAEARRELLRLQAKDPFDPAVQHALRELATPPR